MKIHSLNIKKIVWLIMGITAMFAVSCSKYNTLGFTMGTGAPTITSIHTWYTTDTAVTYDTIASVIPNSDGTTYDSFTLRQNPSVYKPFDSVVTQGSVGNFYVIYGTNLGSATAIYFNGVNAYFNPALSSDKSIVVQIPNNVPYLPPVSDSLTIVTTHGTLNYYFPMLVPPPTPNTYSNDVFTDGSTITMTGIGFTAVTSVSLADAEGSESPENVTIVSQSETSMTLQFSSTNINVGNLVFNYNDFNNNNTPKTLKATQQLINMDNAYQIVVNGSLLNGWGSWSWDATGTTTDFFKPGATASYSMTFTGGGWKVDGFRNNGGNQTDGLPYSADWKYLSFWVKGGSTTETLYIQWGNGDAGGLGQNAVNPITIAPSTWQFFKIAIPTLNWNLGSTPWSANPLPLNMVAFFMNSNSATEVLYFDNIFVIK